MAATKIFVPGQKICDLIQKGLSNADTAGKGTYERDGSIFSTTVGQLHIQNQNDDTRLIEIQGSQQTLVPGVDDIVTVRITSVNPRFCRCSILSVADTNLRDTFRGVIRSEDVRATEKDRVDMSRSFRPGDLVIAKVISLGDSQSCLLSTAENELGVVVALSDSGIKMLPISWCEMQCPQTFVKQYRKVAKVQPRYIEGVKR